MVVDGNTTTRNPSEVEVNQSPLYFAITTNKIQLPISQGKEHFCLITKIN